MKMKGKILKMKLPSRFNNQLIKELIRHIQDLCAQKCVSDFPSTISKECQSHQLISIFQKVIYVVELG